jgi:hypothetical protein
LTCPVKTLVLSLQTAFIVATTLQTGKTKQTMKIQDAPFLIKAPHHGKPTSKRTLKVEPFNPAAKYHPAPASTIRLKGQWLHKLGFDAGQSVELTAISPGVLEIRLCDSPAPSKEFQIAAMRLDHALAADRAGRQANGVQLNGNCARPACQSRQQYNTNFQPCEHSEPDLTGR